MAYSSKHIHELLKLSQQRTLFQHSVNSAHLRKYSSSRIIATNLPNVSSVSCSSLNCNAYNRKDLIFKRDFATKRSEAPTNTSDEPQVEDIYQKKTPIEHVLLRPDTYVGTTQATEDPYWVTHHTDKGMEIVRRQCTFVPGLYKIFDEILVNASDNRQRDPKGMNTIRVNIDSKHGTISIFNNGKGIPIQLHKKEGLYIPELVLGNLLTGSNFNDSIAKVTGGRNGYGAKLTNIFSKQFTVETVDAKQGLKYKQTWRNNMGTREDPIITPVHVKGKKPTQENSEEVEGDYTQVTFTPDLSKFGMTTLEEGDILALMERRVYDVAGCNTGIQVSLNNRLLPDTFEQYLDLYKDPEIETEEPPKRYFARVNERWQVGVGISYSGHFSQVSFVNSICTSKGGTHVNYIADQVVKFLMDQLKSKEKELRLNPNHLKHHLDIYVNCLIENPSFDSQTKETLTTKISNFGSSCSLSKSFLQEFANRTGILEYIANWAKVREQNELITKTRANSNVVGIPKLYDANWAGTENGNQCTLILTEGDSAKALAVNGLAALGRDKFGVFPLKGKLLNVRDATAKQLMENAEINNIVAILGLNYDKKYDTPEERLEMRYGKVMLMTDQDHDGSHIKGLFINFINTFWPALLIDGGFLEEFITPIVKATKSKQKKTFYTIPEYEQWKASLPGEELKGWTIKYYKGLGTNTPAEAKEYFSNIDTHRIKFTWSPDSQESIELAFRKDRTEERKEWLSKFVEGVHVDHTQKDLSINDFVHKELVLFSRADNIRSIPSVIDGLKPGQRKVLFACFKRNLKNEIKVAQLAGYVSEQTAYHHGEASLHSTITNMAQDFTGSNNLPLLYPSGQFGSRLQGGKDAASARYLFTRLSHYTRKLFPEVDDELLAYLDDDGQQIQPEYYVPIIPMVLVNGCEGLGTGWSTKVPMYNPVHIIDNLIRKIDGEPMAEIMPWVKGFAGHLEKKGEHNYLSRGVYEIVDNTTITITELPLNVWIDPYKEYLDELVKPPAGVKPAIKNYTMQHTEGSVKFILKMTKPQQERLKLMGIVKKLKLESSLSTGNMILFDSNNQIKKYNNPLEIIEDFYQVRKEFYEKRKAYLTAKLEKEVSKLQNRARFVSLVANGQLRVGNRSKQELLVELEKLEFVKKFEETGGDFDYLLNTSLWNLTNERMNQLIAEKTKKENELKELLSVTALDIYKNELQDLRKDLMRDFC